MYVHLPLFYNTCLSTILSIFQSNDMLNLSLNTNESKSIYACKRYSQQKRLQFHSSQTQTILLINKLAYVVVSRNKDLGKEIFWGKNEKSKEWIFSIHCWNFAKQTFAFTQKDNKYFHILKNVWKFLLICLLRASNYDRSPWSQRQGQSFTGTWCENPSY